MELFDKKFVHFMWDDELKGKRGFLSSGIDALIKMVNEDSDRTEIQKGCERDLPFCKHITVECRLAYYDPNYEVKKAFNKGKRLQFRPKNEHLSWGDCVNPSWDVKLEYRVKPEEEIFITYLARPKHRDCYLTACAEGMWEAVQKEYDAKTKLFVGTWDEAVKWYESREKFTEVIKAWEDGKRIQVTPEGTDKWVELHCEPTWDVKLEYRVKPECPCEDGIDSKACVGCEHSEDGKRKHKPYETVDEFISDFTRRFTLGPRPYYTMPFIWLWDKKLERKCLVRDFESDKVMCGSTSWTMDELFDRWTYLDGSPCGKEC